MSKTRIGWLPAQPVDAYSLELCHWEDGCTHCGAAGGEYRRRADGEPRRIPCISRMIRRPAEATPREVAERRRAMRLVVSHDFSEPRHQAAQ